MNDTDLQEFLTELEPLTTKQLILVRSKTNECLNALKQGEIEKIKATMAMLGISSNDLGDSGKTKKKLEPKYCNPDNPSETWVGRGKAPNWFKEKTNSGIEQDEMLINSEKSD